jgi:hypothetical protein
LRFAFCCDEERAALRIDASFVIAAMGGSQDGREPPPQLDLYEPLLEKEKDFANGNGNGNAANATQNAMIGTKVAPIESLDFE